MAELGLDKQIGPLPAGVWAAVIAAGLGVGYFINKRSKNNAANAPVPLTEQGIGAGGSGFDTVTPSAQPTQTIDTNLAWSRQAINWLISQNVDPATADTAIRKYLNGQVLTLAERAAVSLVLARFGPPPESVPGPEPTAPDPVSGLTGAAPSPTNLILNWLPSSGATSYRIVGDKEDSVIVPPYLRNDLVPGSTTSWTVQAINDRGASDARQISVTQPNPAAPPPPPGGGHHHPPPPAPPPPSPPPPVNNQRWYDVVAGDTLTGISLRMYGTPSRWMDIYNANAAGFEEIARQHGRSSSRGGPNNSPGWYIYPGEHVLIP